jgi:hypothetical protein
MTPRIKDFLAELVTSDRWARTVLGRLCSSPAGTWSTVSSLCRGLDDATSVYKQLTKKLDNEIVAAWLPHPFQPEEAVMVSFYQDDDMASTVAIVNRAYLKEIAPSIPA